MISAIDDMTAQGLDDYQRRRVNTLRRFMILIRESSHKGEACKAAAARTGMAYRSVEALYYKWDAAGDEVLINKSKLKKGRKSAAQRLQITPEERALLRQFALKCDSKQYAIEALADDPRCGQYLRDFIQPYRTTRNYPKTLLSAAKVTPEERALTRGHRAFQLGSHTQLRKNTYLDDEGEHPLMGGDLFECDDMSLNQPFWYEWPYGGDKLSDMFGVRLGRQMLACVDVATGKWLGFDLIGRVRDAYRAEDVVRFLGRICETHGTPRLGFRLERGVWMSNSVRGVKGITDDGERKIIGSVRDAVDIEFVYSPKAKGIVEGSFDFLQTIQALTGITIGRHRGEYEEITKMALACAAARKEPKDCGFKHISEAADTVEQSMGKSDARPKMGRLLKGVPQERFDLSISDRALPHVPEAKRHLFLPVKQIRPIDGGHVRLKVPHYNYLFSFAVPAECGHLGSKYKLLVCFDPANPLAGARVFEAETERKIDFESVPGQSYGIWPYAPDAPQLDRRSKGHRSNAAKKDYLAAARTTFRATGMQVGTGASIDQVADGQGNSTTIERGHKPLATRNSAPATECPRAKAALKARQKHLSRANGQAADRATAKRLLSSQPQPTPTPCTID